MFKLVIQDDEGKTTVVPLIRDEITIGRKEGNTIRLTERNVSRRHARILRNNGEVQIEDLGSYNGIRVNNARIAERVSLRVSDQVQIGDYKLYLKAEGRRAGRRRPHDADRAHRRRRPTEVMPAVSAAPRRPHRCRSRRSRRRPHPNRTPAAIADTDPGADRSRPPPQVAALTQPTGYGKLVVISSNFAGKEFDLTRPQMIIGRTDENDHRHQPPLDQPQPRQGRARHRDRPLHDQRSAVVQRRAGQRPGLRQGRAAPRRHRRSRPRPAAVRRARRGLACSRATPSSPTSPTRAAARRACGSRSRCSCSRAARPCSSCSAAARPATAAATPTTAARATMAAIASGGSAGSSDVAGSGSQVAMVQTVDAAVVEPNPTDEAGRVKVECLQDISDKKWTDATSCAERLMTVRQGQGEGAQGEGAPGAAEPAQRRQARRRGPRSGPQRREEGAQGGRSPTRCTARTPRRRSATSRTRSSTRSSRSSRRRSARTTARRSRPRSSQARSSYGPAVSDRFAGYKCEVVATNPVEHGGRRAPQRRQRAAVGTPPPAQCDARGPRPTRASSRKASASTALRSARSRRRCAARVRASAGSTRWPSWPRATRRASSNAQGVLAAADGSRSRPSSCRCASAMEHHARPCSR